MFFKYLPNITLGPPKDQEFLRMAEQHPQLHHLLHMWRSGEISSFEHLWKYAVVLLFQHSQNLEQQLLEKRLREPVAVVKTLDWVKEYRDWLQQSVALCKRKSESVRLDRDLSCISGEKAAFQSALAVFDTCLLGNKAEQEVNDAK